MNSRLLIVGNSHVAAMRLGWAQIEAENTGADVRFFAANSTLFQQLEMSADLRFGIQDPARYKVRHGNFLVQTFGALTVDLTAFDAVILVGQNTNEVDFLRQFEAFSIDGVIERPGRPRLSKAAFLDFCTGVAKKRLPRAFWQNLKGPRLFLLPPPIPREDCPPASDRYGPWARFAAEGAGLPYLKIYRDRVRALYASLGIAVLSPPDEVHAASGLTRIEFGKDAGKLSHAEDTYQDGDFHHMNGAYGAQVMAHALKAIFRHTSASGDSFPGASLP